jgi:hypothetical protein
MTNLKRSYLKTIEQEHIKPKKRVATMYKKNRAKSA